MAATEFLARPQLDRDTARSYNQTLTRLCRALGDDHPVDGVTPEQVAGVFAATWGTAAARTWNRHRAAIRSFSLWAAGPGRGWIAVDLGLLLERRKETVNRTKVIDRYELEALWERRDVPLREKTLWMLLYDSAARAEEVLGLDVEDLDLEGKRAAVTRKGGDRDWILWESGTARLLPRLLKRPDGTRRTTGPVFLADRKPAPVRAPAAGDTDPVTRRNRLSYPRAKHLFKQTTGWTLHQLRHSRLAHLGEEGWTAPMLMKLSGHTNPRSLAVYVNPSTEAVARELGRRDRNRRRRR